uniref:phospholipase A2 n=1 Tax=Ciona savignyi TaxID=51511 RepID=H2YF35_CIOSA
IRNMVSIFEKLNDFIADPYAVKEFRNGNDYQRSNIVESFDLLAMHKLNGYYDVIMFTPHKHQIYFRLVHLPQTREKEAQRVWSAYKDRLLPILKSSQDCFTTAILSSITTIIRRNDIRSPAHIAVEVGLVDAFKGTRSLAPWLDSQSCENHSTPLHLACEMKQPATVVNLVSAGAVLTKVDDYGNTAFHIALAKNSEEILTTLCKADSGKAINIINKDGVAPLHQACKDNNVNLCKILLDNNANPFLQGKIGLPIHYALKYKSIKITELLLDQCPVLVHHVCAKHGALPLHWCKGTEEIKLLLTHETPVNVASHGGQHPLHVMVERGRLEAAMLLITAHADVCSRGQNGNSALHFAVLDDNVILVKMLLLFGANSLVKNDFGETPGLLAMRSAKPNKETIHMDTVDGVSFNQPNARTDQLKVLCLDGGGIRGLVMTHILMVLERETGRKCRDMFDWISGTSTGGILAIALALGRSAVEAQRLYFRFKDEVFVGSRPYSSEPMEVFLKKEFGEDTTMEILKDGPKLLITAALADRKPVHLHLFRNYDLTDQISSDTKANGVFSKRLSESSLKQLLWKAARSSGAAPTYFRPMGSYLDGGLVSNNPTLDTLTEIHKYNKEVVRRGLGDYRKVGLVLSLGTGQVPTTRARSLDLNWSRNPISLMNTALAGSELVQMVVDVACQTSGYVVERAKAWCETMGADYFRLNPSMEQDIQLNETNNEVLLNLLWDTQVYLHDNKHLIDKIVALL